MRNTKVAIVTNIPTPYRIPLFEELAKSKQIKFEVFFCAETEANRSWHLEKRYNFKHHFLNGFHIKWKKKDEDLFTLHINPSILLELLKRDYDAIICGAYNSLTAVFSLLYAKLFRKPFILWSEQTLQTEPPRPFLNQLIRNTVKKMAMRYSLCHIASGTRTKDFLVENGVKEERIFISPYATDTTFFSKGVNKYMRKKEEIIKTLNIKSQNVIIYVGQLIKRKGIFELLCAFRLLASEAELASLLIVGSGPLEEELKKFCKKNHLDKVKFTGYKQKEELLMFYAISDIFVLPSRGDTWGIVINEAAACGLPIVTTKNAGASGDLVKDGVNGYIVDPLIPKELAIALKKILRDNELRKKMGMASKEIIKDWGIKEAADGFIKTVNYVLS